MRKNIVAGNWKMNTDLKEGLKLASEVINMAADELDSSVELIIAPPFVHLSGISQMLQSTNVKLAAQNCNDHESGAYTGEVSPAMLGSAGVTHVILGHSERRGYFHESSELLARKTDLALAHRLTPIFCCGESLLTREENNHFDFVKTQLTESLFHLSENDFRQVIVAYEPIWAIGTGRTASSEQAQEMHHELRTHVATKYGEQVAQDLSILYGGSCKPSNSVELFNQPDVDGGLIGGASLKSRDFLDIAKSF